MARVNDGSQSQSQSLAEIRWSETEPGHVTARVSGELDIVSAERLQRPFDDLLASGPTRLDLDLSGLAFMDSSGLALLLRVANRLGPLRVYGASVLIQRVIEATGLTGILLVQDGAP
jgi:anti-sigma B factor antagonist